MDQVTVKKKIESGSKKDEEGIYTGVSLAALLNAADPLLLSECATFTTSAADGFSSVLSAEDLSIEDNVLVVYEKDGKALVPFSEGGTGPLRILIQSDEFGNRCTEYLIGVDCK